MADSCSVSAYLNLDRKSYGFPDSVPDDDVYKNIEAGHRLAGINMDDTRAYFLGLPAKPAPGVLNNAVDKWIENWKLKNCS